MKNLTNTAYRFGFAMIASLFFTNVGFAYSEKKNETLFSSDSNHVDSFICNGLLNLVEQNPVDALNNLDQATFQREQLNQAWDETDFLISFCKVIACDRLGRKRESENLQNFLLASLEDDSFDAPTKEVSLTSEETLEAIGFMNGLVTLAPTQEVQVLLQSIVTQLTAEFFPSFEFTTSTSLMNRDWQFISYSKDSVKMQQCSTSKFIKRWKHIFKKTKEILVLIKEAILIFKEAKDILDSEVPS